MSTSDLPESCETHFSQIHHEYIGYQSLTDVPKAHTYKEEKITCAVRMINFIVLYVLNVFNLSTGICVQGTTGHN